MPVGGAADVGVRRSDVVGDVSNGDTTFGREAESDILLVDMDRCDRLVRARLLVEVVELANRLATPGGGPVLGIVRPSLTPTLGWLSTS